VWGSADLLQTLMRRDLVDAFWLMLYPVTLGSGKRLFAGGALPAAFRVTESEVTPKGVVVANYERAANRIAASSPL
jgi:dihydrofolate reductase